MVSPSNDDPRFMALLFPVFLVSSRRGFTHVPCRSGG
jgi:hypothetical protein